MNTNPDVARLPVAKMEVHYGFTVFRRNLAKIPEKALETAPKLTSTCSMSGGHAQTKSCLRITSILDGRVRCFLPVILSTCVSYSITFEYQAQRHLIHSKGTRRDSSIIETLLMGLPNMCNKVQAMHPQGPKRQGRPLFSGRYVTNSVKSA